MTDVKICGLTTPATLDAALAGGAAFVGAVIFPRSPRYLEPLHAATLFDRARGRAKVVAVTVDADDAQLTEVALILKPNLIQLHGRRAPERAARVRALTGAGIIRALAVSSAADIDAAAAWEPGVDHLMFDARPPQGLGPARRGRGPFRLVAAGRADVHEAVVPGRRVDCGQCGRGGGDKRGPDGRCVLWCGKRTGC